MPLFRPLVLALLLFCVPGHCAEPKKVSISRNFQADAQLNLKASYEQGEPIRVGCTCKPTEGVTLTTEWSYSAGLKAIDIDDLTKDVWAKPGPQKITVKLKLLRTHKLTVLVPGPNWPADPKDLKQQVIEVFDGYTESTLEGEFVQQGTVTPPGPTPPPVDPPVPPPPNPTPAVGPLKVLILEETADRSKYDQAHPGTTGAYLSSAVASYLRTHTGPAQEWNVWDDDFTDAQIIAGGFPNMLDIYTRAKINSGANTGDTKEPWVVIEQKDATGKPITVHTGPVTPDLLNTLKRYGGN